MHLYSVVSFSICFTENVRVHYTLITIDNIHLIKSKCLSNGGRLAKFKRPHVLGDQKISEDNQELRPGCPPDYQEKEFTQKVSSQQIFQVIFLLPTKTAV